MIEKTIEDVVRSHLHFKSTSNAGWNTLYCEVCGDGGRTKGPRGGWKFEGEFCVYRCFNCGISANFSSDREHPYSQNMWKVFEAFGIPEPEHKAVAYKNALKKDKDFEKPKKLELKFETLPIPDHFYKINSTKNAMTEKAILFLKERGIEPHSYPFYLSTGVSKQGPKEEAMAKSMFNRLIIPAFHKENMIYFQARNLDEENKKRQKYLNPAIPKSNIIYGYDKLYKDLDSPLYITEGFFDSHHLDGVAVLENKMSQIQIDMLSRSQRRKIIVPDRTDKKDQKKHDDGKELIRQALELGWEVSFPTFGGLKDVSASVKAYGRLQTINDIVENIKSGFPAKVAMQFF